VEIFPFPVTAMLCPNCRSSWIRRSKRNDAEKFIMPLVFLRPFRCEDCVSRFYGWIWAEGSTAHDREASTTVRPPELSSGALHSGFRRSRNWRRKIEKHLTAAVPRNLFSGPVTSWLKKPINQPSRRSTAALAHSGVSMAEATPTSPLNPPPPPFEPKILGVITEIKSSEDNVN
jgi:hypothetical protein